MKKKYEKLLRLAKEALARYHVAFPFDSEATDSGEDDRKAYNAAIVEVCYPIEKLIKTGDTEVLCELFDFFLSEKVEDYDICENLEDFMSGYFSEDQVLQVFYKKFDVLAEKNPERCVGIAYVNFFSRDENDPTSRKFREMFNTIKSQHSEKFLEELKSFLFAGSCLHKIDEMNKICVHALEEDMKSW
ncbi:MAG: hypothetical protein LBJ45_02590 [Holosporaceae bacterium]|jgi:Rad3-related DNA helicase|nr:hypothetical protein [Holosporaceae bacterium]